jgi:hypothetical protein
VRSRAPAHSVVPKVQPRAAPRSQPHEMAHKWQCPLATIAGDSLARGCRLGAYCRCPWLPSEEPRHRHEGPPAEVLPARCPGALRVCIGRRTLPPTPSGQKIWLLGGPPRSPALGSPRDNLLRDCPRQSSRVDVASTQVSASVGRPCGHKCLLPHITRESLAWAGWTAFTTLGMPWGCCGLQWWRGMCGTSCVGIC